MTKIPIAELVDQGVKDLQYHYGEILDTFAKEINSWIKTLGQLLLLIPWWALIVVFALVAWRAKGWKLAAGTAAGLGLIYNLNLWPAFLDTLILVMISALVSMAVGIPLGILAAKNDKFNWLISPVLDFMQTMPAYVYLIPALLFLA